MRQLFLISLLACKPAQDDLVADSDADTDVDTDTDADTDPTDADGDGFGASVDCDDGDSEINPGASDICDGIDNNCDGLEVGDEDADSDGALDCLSCEEEGLFVLSQDLDGAALSDALHDATASQGCSSYTAARIFMFGVLDPRPDGMLECVYTTLTTTPDGSTTPGNFNTEHTWPQSQGAENLPARCDLHHLYPTDADANNRRGSFPFGIVSGSSTWAEGGSQLGTDASGETVFEPREPHKGNVARSLLYFSFRYGFTVDPDYRALLEGWSSNDPPDALEVARTRVIRDEQGSVNPLVVCPFLVEAL